jgi:O-antigen ligase
VLDLASWQVFLDHPIFGVGPGQFAKHYSTNYVNRIGLIEQRKDYLAHNLYLEKLAETGLIGSLCFLSILVAILYRLWQQRGRFVQSRPEFSLIATGFFLSLVAFAISSAFAHLAYQRYFWLLLAVASAATRIIQGNSQTSALQEPAFR